MRKRRSKLFFMDKKIIASQLTGRTIAISDIHGHLDLFEQLLDKVHYSAQDNLIIIGDYVEKGEQILDTIHRMQDLALCQNVYILNGNCEWAVLDMVYHSYHLKHYLNNVSYSIFHEVFRKHCIDYRRYEESTLKILAQLLLKEELAFIESCAVMLKTKEYIFVHAGIEDRLDFENSSLSSLLEQRYFMNGQHPLEQCVVVGHLPAANYHLYHIDNRIIIDENKCMISIDGGVGVKIVCQLNALIIDQGYQTQYVRPFKHATIKKAYYPGICHHHKVTWPHYEVSVLKRQDEFSLCQKVYNKEKLSIKNEFLYFKNDQWYCQDDYIDYHVNVEVNDVVDVIDIYGKYAYIIKDHEVGWILKDCLMNM